MKYFKISEVFIYLLQFCIAQSLISTVQNYRYKIFACKNYLHFAFCILHSAFCIFFPPFP
jgi:hypothetical protein